MLSNMLNSNLTKIARSPPNFFTELRFTSFGTPVFRGT